MRKPKKAMEQALKLVADSPGSANANTALFSTHSGRLPGTLAEEEGASQCDPTVHSRKQQATVQWDVGQRNAAMGLCSEL